MRPLLLLLTLFISSSVLAQNLYVTDEFKVTLRTGKSTSNSIVTMLKSGEAVELIEHDAASKYSLVKTKSGKEGYVLTRFLENQPSHKQRLKKLNANYAQLKTQYNELKQQYQQLLTAKSALEKEEASLAEQLKNITNQYEQLQESTQDTQAILAQNTQQTQLIEQLQAEKSALIAENTAYKDNTAMNWFIRGAGVSLIAFLLGIIVTRIQWKKRQSWDEF